VPADDPRLLNVLALAVPVERGRSLVDRLAAAGTVGQDPDRIRLLGEAATAVGAFDQSTSLLDAAVVGLRTQGRLGLLSQALVSLAWTQVHQGNPAAGAWAADEAERLSTETGQPMWAAAAQAAGAALAGLGGDGSRARALAARAESVFLPLGAGPMLALVQVARGSTALAEGRPDAAFAELVRIHDPADPAYHQYVRCWTVLDLADAGVHSGRRDEARALLAALAP
jgi:hypothetical protein